MIILEKLFVLQSVSLFQYIPDEVLLNVAEVAKEQIAEPGELIIKKGDLGTIMYIIVEGKVEVHDEGKRLAVLGKHDVFGELAALSLETRTRDISALEETCLLTIESETLYDLIDRHKGLAKGIILMLCQRARSMSTPP